MAQDVDREPLRAGRGLVGVVRHRADPDKARLQGAAELGQEDTHSGGLQEPLFPSSHSERQSPTWAALPSREGGRAGRCSVVRAVRDRRLNSAGSEGRSGAHIWACLQSQPLSPRSTALPLTFTSLGHTVLPGEKCLALPIAPHGKSRLPAGQRALQGSGRFPSCCSEHHWLSVNQGRSE